MSGLVGSSNFVQLLNQNCKDYKKGPPETLTWIVCIGILELYDKSK